MATKILREAIAKAEALPTPDQERIGRGMERYIESLAELRGKLDQGLRSLDA